MSTERFQDTSLQESSQDGESLCSSDFIGILQEEVVPALGCTEPIAVALAAAYAAELLPEPVQNISVGLSPNVMKNGMGVGIPNTGEVGLEIAAALGAIGGDASQQLEVLSNITQEQVQHAKEMVQSKCIKLSLLPTPESIRIEVTLQGEQHSSKAVIANRHTWLESTEADGKVIYQNKEIYAKKQINDRKMQLSIHNIYEFATTVPLADIQFLQEGAVMNRRIAELGLNGTYGLGIGRNIMHNIQKGILGDDLLNYASAMTVAATDARMSGCNLPVMSNSGSGNQGLSIILPVVAVAEKLRVSDETRIRALAIAHLIAIHIKSYIGVLSSLCGCIIAGSGASAAIAYMMGGKEKELGYTVQNIIGNVSGMICDGAKTGCALKVATGTSVAVQAALFALESICISEHDGIISNDVEKSIKNLANVVLEGMKDADKAILGIMLNK